MGRPQVIAFCGLPGSGKSTLAKLLEPHTNGLRLDRDALRSELFAVGGYTSEEKEFLNREMRERMRAQLCKGNSVILDGMTLSRADEREQFRSEAVALQAEWKLVWLDCPVEVARSRVSADRSHVALDRTPAIVSLVADRFEPPGEALRLDASRPPSHLLQTLLAEVLRRSRSPAE